ncbi:piggyBac transposable element-derived protein 4-like isoform X2 [Ranitomeya imitator]|uniref:piggyBac transposable element-derived protein 4-like isoform X2 n=1 Tax=Ranitomeya imitator TaxID=111125 RepID=UPI0037E71BBC
MGITDGQNWRDLSSKRTTPERCPRPLLPQDCNQEDPNVPQDHQGEDLTHINTTETYVTGDEWCKEEIPTYDYPDVFTRNSERHMVSSDLKAEDHDITPDTYEEHVIASDITSALHNNDVFHSQQVSTTSDHLSEYLLYKRIFLNYPSRMDMDRDKMVERILHLTLEILFRLTGEDYTVVKKTSSEYCQDLVSEGWGRLLNPITGPPPHPLIHEDINNQKILELTYKMTELLTGEVPIRCQDVAVYFSMEEWEYLEGHRDLYKEVMMEVPQPLTSPDLSSKRTTPERCPHPLLPQDCNQEDPNVPQDLQGEDLIHINSTETYVRGDERYKEEIPTYGYPGSDSPMVVDWVMTAEDSEAGTSTAVPPMLWHHNSSFSPQIPPFLATPGIKVDVANFTPFDFFQIFITPEVLQLIAHQTNLYARQCISQKPTSFHSNSWIPTNVAEIKQFLGLTLNMGLVKKNTLRSYWAPKSIHSTPVFAAVMSRTRYETLMRFLHFSDNSQAPPRSDDRLNKLRPLITLLKDLFLNSYTPEQNVAVDESLISYKGRLIFRQFVPSKRAKYSFKLYKLCESTTGYTSTFIICEGSDRQLSPPNCPPTIGIPGKIVWELMMPFLYQGYHVYTDFYYTSIPLYQSLHAANTGACGTVRENRVGFPTQLVSRRLKKGASFSLASDQLLAVKWNDKKDVYMLTTLHADTHVTVRHSGATRDKKKPVCVTDFNKYMGGVDLSDQVLQPYLVKRKTRAWYKKVAIYLIQIATYNSFVLYKRSQGELTFLQYQEKIIECLLFGSTQAQEAVFESEDVRRLSERHFIHAVPATSTQKYPQKRCRVCRKNGKRSDSRYYCPMCPSQPGLCVTPCFEIYHTNY